MTQRSQSRSPLERAPSFDDFYSAINGLKPFPWQSRLAEQVALTGGWPPEIGIPTGIGKTACLEIAVWWLATQAGRDPRQRTAPTRIWWVVNRRLLVDSTADHAEFIARALAAPDSNSQPGQDREVIAKIGERLRRVGSSRSANPLEVIRLRGGISAKTAADPSRPTIMLCTLPMYASRLMFRGYGIGRRRRALDAAMAGTDSLVLLDEAHLAPHLKSLVSALADCAPASDPVLNRDRTKPQVVALTATGDRSEYTFDLDDADFENRVVSRRMHSAKPLELRTFESGQSAQLLADAALDLIDEATKLSSFLIFANTPEHARTAFEQIRNGLGDGNADYLLLTGMTREREAARIRKKILDPICGMPANRSADSVRLRHLVVVSTQTLEVGADIDADFLVTEACGVRALTQRLGRLNRLGRHQHTRAIYVHSPPPRRRSSASTMGGMDLSWPVYGKEPAMVLQRLQSGCKQEGDRLTIDVSPAEVANKLGVPRDNPGRAPEVMPAVLWEWIKTSTASADEAPIEPYFSGIHGESSRVGIIWRIHIPQDGERLWPRVNDREVVEAPIGRVRAELSDEKVRRLSPDFESVETIGATDLRPGDRIILATNRGMLDEFGWNPESKATVMDDSLAEHGLPLTKEALASLIGVNLGEFVDKATRGEGEDLPDVEIRNDAVRQILEQVRLADKPEEWPADEWGAFTAALQPELRKPDSEVARLPITARIRWVFDEEFNSEFDEASLSTVAIEIDEHCRAVGELAGVFARCIGIREDLVSVVETSGIMHDIGKYDARFQRWLDPEGVSQVPVAKSAVAHHLWEGSRVASGWPRGGRHEALSARLAQEWLIRNPMWCDLARRDLLIHLVLSHHGTGRPLVAPACDGYAGRVSAQIDGELVSVAADLSVVDWEQPKRFHGLCERYGPWGLALLEALVVRADHLVSGGVAIGKEVGR